MGEDEKEQKALASGLESQPTGWSALRRHLISVDTPILWRQRCSKADPRLV
jgi:hypothetical protein